MVLKSAMVAVAGTGLFFCFFMLVSIPLLTLFGAGTDLRTPGAVVAPAHWFRHAGLPLSAAAFVASFVMGWKKFNSVRQ